MALNHERRIAKLERLSPADTRPWLQIITKKNETVEEVFAREEHPGKLSDYRIIRIRIIEPPKRDKDEDTAASLGVEGKSIDSGSEVSNTPVPPQDCSVEHIHEEPGGQWGWMT